MQSPEGLVERLQAVAYPSRMKVLLSLREPKPIGEIEVQPTNGQSEGATNGSRNITREGVRHHLSQLRDAGLVETQTAREGPHKHLYRTRPDALYQLSETLRQLSVDRTRSPGADDPPFTWDKDASPGPTLTVVHGAEIGDTFRLKEQTTDVSRGWVLGRSPKADILLDWDPDVEDQAAEIVWKDDRYRLVDLRAASHRTSLNGDPLERGEERYLEHGDLIGVGRTLLTFRAS